MTVLTGIFNRDEKRSNKMSEMTAEALGYIEKSIYALLITVGEENKPCVRYVGPFVNNGLDIYFFTSKDSRKVKHVECNPFVTLYR
jgi:general stress protein 26